VPCKADEVRAKWSDHLGWVASLLLIGVAAKLRLILKSGSPFPYWDQWPADAINLFIPYFNHQFSLGTLFQAHNEHRIVFTRLCELGLLLANGQWDSQLEMVVNAFIHAAAIAGFGWLLASLTGKRNWPLLWIVLALDLVLPFAWENTLWGFQTHFYFLMIFSLLTIWLLGLNAPLSRRWWLGVMTAVCGLFTMASGFLAVDAVAAVVLLQVLKQRQKWRDYAPTLGVCVAVTIAGLLLRPNLPANEQVKSAGDFLTALGKSLAWPWAIKPLYAPFNLFPFLLLGWRYFRSQEDLPAERVMLGIGLWAVLQSLAAAYARGAGGPAPAWRYMDVLSLLMIANSLSIQRLLTRYREQLRFSRFWQASFAVWALGCLSGLWFLSERAWDVYIPEVVAERRLQLENARAFMATEDVRVLLNQPPEQLIVGNVDAVVWLLRHPVVRRILPACARDALNVIPKEGGEGAFIRNGAALAKADPPTEICWGSFSARGRGARGRFESLPVRKSALPYLEIPIVGDLGELGLSLELVDLTTGQTVPVRASKPGAEGWVNVYVKAPAGEFKLVAHDDSETAWFAFKEPRELGRLSYWAMRMVAGWKYFLVAGLACLVVSSLKGRMPIPGRFVEGR
jgi:hypothetical protein